jgi:hypothetical protein
MTDIALNVFEKSFFTRSILWILFIFATTTLASESPIGDSLEIYPAIDGFLDVQSLDVVTEGATLHALLSGRFDQGEQIKVAYVFSHDQGKTWSIPVILTHQGDAPVISRRGNDVQLAALGSHRVAVWQSRGDLPSMGPMVVAYSKDGGKTWERGDNPAVGDTLHNQSYMDMVMDQVGHIHLVWLDDREEHGNTQGLRYAKSLDGGQHWQAESTIDASVCTCCWNRLALLSEQIPTVLFRDTVPHDMMLGRGSLNGKTWQIPSAVGAFDWQFEGCPHCGGGLTGIALGKKHALHSVVWTGKESESGLYYLFSSDEGQHWSKPRRIGDWQHREGDIAALSPKRLGIVFNKVAAKSSTIHFMDTNDGGRHWSEPVTLSPSGVVADHPRILATRSGFSVVWTEKRMGGGKTWAMKIVNYRD